jgi:hypothetical protein
MQAIRPNSGLNYQSLDVPLYSQYEVDLPDRIFKYNHIIRLNSGEFNLTIGDRIKQSNRFWTMSINGVKRDGFFAGTLIKPNASNQMFRFPLYKTVEEYLFYKN